MKIKCKRSLATRVTEPRVASFKLSQYRTLLVLVILLAGCDRADRPSVGAMAGGVGVFRLLDSVALGMSPKEISKLRPVTSAPYIGLVERLPNGRVEYRFGKEAPGEGWPRGNLSRVTARYSLEAPAAHDSAVGDAFDVLLKMIGPLSDCLNERSLMTRATYARWRRGLGVVELVVVQNHPDSAARTGIPVHSMLLTVRDSDVDVPRRIGSANALPPEACRSALRLTPDDRVRTP